MKVLVACEESQVVTEAFRNRGFEAYSCDIIPTSGKHPEWHIQDDVLNHLEGWDLIIAHPPCTYLAVSGARWFYHPEDKHLPTEKRRPHPKFPNRRQNQEDAIKFFMSLINAPCDHIAVENPVTVMSTKYRKPDQIINPYEFGEPFSKKTCLWLKGLPLLEPTEIVDKGEIITYESGRKMAKWYAELIKLPKEERQKLRSKTFVGIANAMATQWGNYLNSQILE